jgi:hypothetical protein
MGNIAIVVITYSRKNSLLRLLKSLKNVDYLGDSVDLIISIDYSGNDEILKIAQGFYWEFGEKKIISHSIRLGLRAHVLKCGELTNSYEHICVLEDDLLVSPGLYNFAKQATLFYESDENVAGISLYTHLYNHIANRPFYPLDDGYDVFFLKQAQSWGQIWSKRKWTQFKIWYEKNIEIEFNMEDFPTSIASWPENSWLKYHNKYLVVTNKYFVFPRISLTTNFSDPGTNRDEITTTYQVPLQLAVRKKYVFSNFRDSFSRYDIFFEFELLGNYLPFTNGKVVIDLYNSKKKFSDYLLSTNQSHDFNLVGSFGLVLRPPELNIIYKIEGHDIFLYKTSEKATRHEKKYNLEKDLNRFLYDTRIPISIIHFIATKILLKKIIWKYIIRIKKLF